MAYFRDVAILGVSRRGVDAKTQIEKNTPSKHKSFSYENGISVSCKDAEQHVKVKGKRIYRCHVTTVYLFLDQRKEDGLKENSHIIEALQLSKTYVADICPR